MKPYSYIRGALRQYDIDQQYIAEQLGRSRTYVSNRLSGRGTFTLDEAYQIMRMCGVPHSDIYKAFPPGGTAVHDRPKPRLYVVRDTERTGTR